MSEEKKKSPEEIIKLIEKREKIDLGNTIRKPSNNLKPIDKENKKK